MKKVKFILITCICFCLLLSGCQFDESNGKIKITATCISCYDFARAVAGDKADISLILPPGTDIHSFEPTINDISGIQESDLFIYIGGESDTWVERVLDCVENVNSIKMANYVDLSHEHEHTHNHKHSDHEYDEHIWTSPANAEIMINAISEALSMIDAENSHYYNANAAEYIEKINHQAALTAEVVELSRTKHIVVADRFPFKYLTDYYNLGYTAAFSGCDEDTDADLTTVIKLIETVEQKEITGVFVTELSTKNLAETVSRQTGAKIIELHSFHNISAEDFKNGITYLDVLERNRLALAEGLK